MPSKETSSTLLIQEMNADDLSFAAACTSAEGWRSEDRTTLEGFFLYDPRGCLIAREDGQPVGICIATCYGKSGFIGELIVRPEARGRGVGAALLNKGVQVLTDRGVETVYLDGVVKAVSLYERNGFHKVCRSWRFQGNLAGKSSSHVRPMTSADLDEVTKLDKLSFGEDRSFFIRRRMETFPALSYVLLKADQITGFIMGRSGEDWVSAGPWMITEETENFANLLYVLALESAGRPISIGILDSNQQACNLVHSLGFTERMDSPWRMALGRSDDLGASPLCFAVGSAAKG